MKRTKVTVSYRHIFHDWEMYCADSASNVEYYTTKREAVIAGRQAAKTCWANGALSQLVIKGKNNRIQTEHTYGRDPVRHKG